MSFRLWLGRPLRCKLGYHELDMMERSWTVPHDGTTWLHCARCQIHAWTVPSRLIN